jgi:hypothetical protein
MIAGPVRSTEHPERIRFPREFSQGLMMKAPPVMFVGILLAIFAIFMLAMFVFRMMYPAAQPGVGG